MSPELDQQLCERHPRIFVERHGDPMLSAMPVDSNAVTAGTL